MARFFTLMGGFFTYDAFFSTLVRCLHRKTVLRKEVRAEVKGRKEYNMVDNR